MLNDLQNDLEKAKEDAKEKINKALIAKRNAENLSKMAIAKNDAASIASSENALRTANQLIRDAKAAKQAVTELEIKIKNFQKTEDSISDEPKDESIAESELHQEENLVLKAKPRRSRKKVVLFSLLILFLALGGLYVSRNPELYLKLKGTENDKIMPEKIDIGDNENNIASEDVESTNDEVNQVENESDEEIKTEEPEVKKEQKTLPAEPKSSVPRVARQAEPKIEKIEIKPRTENKVASNNSSSGSSGQVVINSFIISCAAVSSEEAAKKASNDLKSKGFKSGYYYLPDYQSGAKSLYKVFVGSFNSRADAEGNLGDVKNLFDGAYVMQLKKN